MEIKQNNEGKANAFIDPDKKNALVTGLFLMVLLVVGYMIFAPKPNDNSASVVKNSPALQGAAHK